MDVDNNIPLLFSFYFGDSAPSAQRGASRRLKKWSRAFEQWIDERRRDYQKDTVKQALLAWKRLVSQCGKMPWEVSREDIDKHTAWMKEQGFAANTINNTIGIISSFYQWCDERGADAACEAGFNPAYGATRIKIRRYEGACVWNREEVRVFLDLLNRDESELGKREYAFFLTRLNLGVSLEKLRVLEWGQIEQDVAGAWVKWRQDRERVRLPDKVWQGIREYLQASGRLEGMRGGKYIFAPLAYPGREGTGSRAEDWLEEKELSSSTILSNLKLYGRQVGIGEGKLNLQALRRTAIRLRMDQGESLEGMMIFMDSEDEIKSTKHRLSWLPESNRMAGESTDDLDLLGREVEVPDRRAKPFREGEHTTHGFYTRKKDKQALDDILAENIQGVKEETGCLRVLMRGLLEREGDDTHLVEEYSHAAQRLASMISASEPSQETKRDRWVDEVLNWLDEIEIRRGRPPIGQGVREMALGYSRGTVVEEIATLRLLLRKAYKRAMQEIATREYVRVVDLYGLGCVRLNRLLRIGGGDGVDRLERYVNDSIDEAIRQVNRELRGKGAGS